MDITNKLKQVIADFRLPAKLLSYEELKNGNINNTYKINCEKLDNGSTINKSYIVQKVNTYVFKRPEYVMENIDLVTEHLRHKNPNKINLHFHHLENGKNYIVDEDKGFWRLFNFVPSVTFNTTDDLNVFFGAGKAFGEFQRDLSDCDASKLHDTIPNFHNTKSRYQNLEDAVKEDAAGRVKEVERELDWLYSVKDKACQLVTLQEQGVLPLRVTHNDTKINNVLFDEITHAPLVVIDLDTVMPGLVGCDFGDAIRFGANAVIEDSPDYDNSKIKLDVFKAFTQGFIGETKDALTQDEKDTLALSAFCLTAELVVRFLEDYIRGDVYFKIKSPDHNLIRTRNQVALASDMLKNMDKMEAIVKECCK